MPQSLPKLLLVLLLVASAVGSAAVWLVPVEIPQNWAFQRAGDDPYSQFEAVGQMEALWWLGRFTLPLLCVATAGIAWRFVEVYDWCRGVLKEFLSVTCQQDVSGKSAGRAAKSALVRLLIASWLLLAGVHLWGAIDQRTREWPYYRLRSGGEVLPNISESNRDVIRYLREATPPESRILAVSDQKLFFLSYYLLPRRLFHPTHPEAEFVIPLANQQRQLSAYRLQDLDHETISRIRPDYILEYFEGSAFVEEDRRGEDQRWVRFWRERNRSTGLPPYVVVLRPCAPEGQP